MKKMVGLFTILVMAAGLLTTGMVQPLYANRPHTCCVYNCGPFQSFCVECDPDCSGCGVLCWGGTVSWFCSGC